MTVNIDNLVRENIRNLVPYATARHEFTGTATVFLDANENAFGSPLEINYNRYPDPQQQKLKTRISEIKGVPVSNMFIGNGSDEAIDLLFRIFCEPGKDNVMILPPTYGMYEVCAAINNVQVKKVNLTPAFQLNLDAIEKEIDPYTRIIFICSPNNPTGNSINRSDIEVLLNNFEGIIVIDEAYINFARLKTFIPELMEYPQLVILQTLSKAWGLAGLRLGMAFAGQPIIEYMNRVKYPYNISTATQQLALEALSNVSTVNDWIEVTVIQREWLSNALNGLHYVQEVYPSDANFLLVKMKDARKVYEYLADRGIIVRDRSHVILCDDCLRITVGTPEENMILMEILEKYK
jgi:histidinol-phosphate aminotransferase